MTKFYRRCILILLVSLLLAAGSAYSQPCTTLGQTPSTAFPVCGTTVFQQNTVPICATNDIFVPGCPGGPGGAQYQNKNPFFYKFTCYTTGTLGFLITPLAPNEDYDWQLYDITGRIPEEIFTNNSLVVTGNWAGTYGPTGTSSSGVSFIQCASVPADNAPTFSAMPTLQAGRQYLLMISHYTDSQSGYTLSFGGGTAVITDPNMPHMASAKADCDGTKIFLRLNKKILCNSQTLSGSEFSIVPAITTVISATTDSCSFGFDFDDVTLTLAGNLVNGNYQLVINDGTDNNTLKDHCDHLIPQGESVPFTYAIPQPIFADSIGKVGCAPDSIVVFFPKNIICATIAPNGTDFSVAGPSPVTVNGARGNCVNGKTDRIIVKFASPITVGGNYQLTLKAGDDGTVVIDECGQPTPVHTLPFVTADTVNADFTYGGAFGCQRDTLTFMHDGAHQVNSWSWTFNNQPPVTTQQHTIVFPATSTNEIQLVVSNGTCSDTSQQTVILDNEVKARFTTDSIICPEDPLAVINLSTGQIDSYLWQYDVIGTSTLKDPPPFLFPSINAEAYYTVRLICSNNLLNCRDTARKTLTVLDHCFIDIPTAFTPNNDGLNDNFGPHNALKATNYHFRIFNRWGQPVFESKNWRDRWDGKVKGVVQTTGVFVWMLSYTTPSGQSVFRKGTVAVIR